MTTASQQTVDNLSGTALSRLSPQIDPKRVRALRPLGDWVVVDPMPAPEKEGSIYIPEKRQRKAGQGRNGRGVVVAVGPGGYRRATRRTDVSSGLPVEVDLNELLGIGPEDDSRPLRYHGTDLQPGDLIAYGEGVVRDEISGFQFVRADDIFGVLEENVCPKAKKSRKSAAPTPAGKRK